MNLFWTIEIWDKEVKDKPIMIGSNLERELRFWLEMNRESDARAGRRTGAKEGTRYRLKAYLHENNGPPFEPGTGFDYRKGKLTEFKFDEKTRNWV